MEKVCEKAQGGQWEWVTDWDGLGSMSQSSLAQVALAVRGGLRASETAGWCSACGVLGERAVVGCSRCRLRGRIWSSEYL